MNTMLPDVIWWIIIIIIGLTFGAPLTTLLA
jgi:hypothetical protein